MQCWDWDIKNLTTRKCKVKSGSSTLILPFLWSSFNIWFCLKPLEITELDELFLFFPPWNLLAFKFICKTGAVIGSIVGNLALIGTGTDLCSTFRGKIEDTQKWLLPFPCALIYHYMYFGGVGSTQMEVLWFVEPNWNISFKVQLFNQRGDCYA